MAPFTVHDGLVVPLDRSNVDTDLIIPKQFLKSIKRTGFGPNLFDELRYSDAYDELNPDGARISNPDFSLNKPEYAGASILLSRENFGCGSSHLAQLLDSPAILSDFSRLVIDPNRGEDDPTLLMKLYDGTIIPANRYADEAERERRLDALYRPFHDAYAALVRRRDDVVVCAIHSFTTQLKGRPPRPWDVGVLYAGDDRLARPFIAACRAQGWCVGDRSADGARDASKRH